MNRQKQIELAKRLIATGISEELVEVLHQQFPEIKESEDERTRKNCIHFLELQKAHHADTSEIDDCIAYLEKQKEHKPAEYEKPLLSKFEQAIYDCAWGKVTCKPEGETQEEYAKRWAEHLLLMVRDWADDYIDSQIELAKRKAYDMGKADAEKPAEWSEEDEKMIQSLILEIDKHVFFAGIESNKIINFLKSLRPQPHWKPGEEQMEWLESAVRLSTNKPHIHGIIISLYEQLKKL